MNDWEVMGVDVSGIVSGIGAAIIAFGAAVSAVYFQQKNRRADKQDQEVLQIANTRVQDTVAALDAWRHIVDANNVQIVALQNDINAFRARNEELEEELRQLRIEYDQLARRFYRLNPGAETGEAGD